MTLPTRRNSKTFIASPKLTFTSIDTEMEVINGVETDPTTVERPKVDQKRGLHPPTKSRNSSPVVPIDGKIYRFDEQHQKFEASERQIEPRIHVTVKAKPPGEVIALDRLLDHQNALRISKGAGIEPIVVSQFESIDITSLEISQLASDLDDRSPGNSEATATLSIHSENQPEGNTELQPSSIPCSDVSVTTHDNLIETHQNEAPIADHRSESVPAPREHLEPAENSDSSPQLDDSISLPSEPLVPAWEVGRFRWPGVINNLSTQHKPAFVRLLDSLKVRLGDDTSDCQRIGVIHTRAGQGATTLAACLAKIISETGNVLLVDLDWVSPNLEETANIKLQRGWQELLHSDLPLSEYLVRETTSGITLMPLRSETELSAESPMLLNKIKEISPNLTRQFDFSIFDIGNAKNLMIAENCHVGFLDAAVIVSDSKGDDSFAISIYEQLIAAGVPSVVIAENFRQKSRSVA